MVLASFAVQTAMSVRSYIIFLHRWDRLQCSVRRITAFLFSQNNQNRFSAAIMLRLRPILGPHELKIYSSLVTLQWIGARMGFEPTTFESNRVEVTPTRPTGL